MRKFLPIITLAFASLFIYSCDNDDDVVQTEQIVLTVRDVTGTFNTNNGFQIEQGLTLQPADAVLVYRNINSNTTNSPVWQLIPKTYYLDDVQNLPVGRELDYNFDFTTQDVQIRTEANFNQSSQITGGETSQFLTNQTFRIVLLPAVSGKNANAVDTNDYNAVIKYYNIDDSNVVNTKVN
jgi:hypothetical protein